MDGSRRGFLKLLGLGTVGAGLGLGAGRPLLERATLAGREVQGPGDAARAVTSEAAGGQWAMVVDVEKCLSEEVREACSEACRRAHNVPIIPDEDDRIEWIWTEEYEHALPDHVHDRTPEAVRDAPVLVLCNHCTEPPCTKVCPTGATWKRDSDGIVMMDMHRCIGCRYCIAACPYGARSFNFRDPRPFVETDAGGKPVSDYPTRTQGVVEKCNFCAERLRDGLPPACVEAADGVPGASGALVFGDLSDPESEVSRVLSERITVRRREDLGTGPNVYYLVPPDLAARVRGEEARP
jgi:molybdopterin-containing oxidoreductase family iron-sulfur binding subunit